MTWQNAINTKNEHEVCKVQYDKEKFTGIFVAFHFMYDKGVH
jgi:hypothetical protein